MNTCSEYKRHTQRYGVKTNYDLDTRKHTYESGQKILLKRREISVAYYYTIIALSERVVYVERYSPYAKFVVRSHDGVTGTSLTHYRSTGYYRLGRVINTFPRSLNHTQR